jgi:hypothetical protein
MVEVMYHKDSFSIYCCTIHGGEKHSTQWNKTLSKNGIVMVVYVHWVTDIIGKVNIADIVTTFVCSDMK